MGVAGGDKSREMAERTTILRAPVGSTLHGLHLAGTDDRDEMGVCVEDLSNFAGFSEFEQFIYRTAAERAGKHDEPSAQGDLDLTIYSLRKWLRLAMQGNPTVLILLFVPSELCVVRDARGASLQDLAPLIVSRQAGKRFLGYLEAQRQRLLGERGQKKINRPDLEQKHGYDTKYAMHMLRLGHQGCELLQTGRITLPMPEPTRQHLRDVREGKIEIQDVLQETGDLERRLKDLTSDAPLPEYAAQEEIQSWMLSMYWENWRSRNDTTLKFGMPTRTWAHQYGYMRYLHIDNLYKAQEILEFKRVYALEKIHGTSAHVAFKNGALTFFSGGEKHANFVALFDVETLAAKFAEKFIGPSLESDVTVYGEAYGGKCQHMSATYGPSLKFIAFDVKIGDAWLSVPNAHGFVTALGLEFVDYALVSTDLADLDAERDKPSTQAARNGISEPKIREGVVLRPFYEWTDHRGNRVIVKHKRAEFAERGRPNVELDPSRREMLDNAEAIALEWVTPMRLEHVIDAVLSARANKDIEMRDTPAVIAAMIEDVTREAAGEITDNAPARKAIGQRAVQLFKQRIQTISVGQ